MSSTATKAPPLIGAWYVTAAAAAVYCKLALPPRDEVPDMLSGVAAVVELTLSQCLVGALVLNVLLRFRHRPGGIRKATPLTNTSCRMLLISAGHLVGNLCTNAMYLLSSASVTQVLKASEPVCTVLMMRAFFGSSYSAAVYSSIAVIIAGVSIAAGAGGSAKSAGAAHASLWPVVALCVVSNTTIPLRNVLSKGFLTLKPPAEAKDATPRAAAQSRAKPAAVVSAGVGASEKQSSANSNTSETNGHHHKAVVAHDAGAEVREADVAEEGEFAVQANGNKGGGGGGGSSDDKQGEASAAAAPAAPSGFEGDGVALFAVVAAQGSAYLLPVHLALRGLPLLWGAFAGSSGSSGLATADAATATAAAAALADAFVPQRLTPLLLAGLFHGSYNVFSFLVLDSLGSPISHAIANVFKRVFSIAIALVYFAELPTPIAAAGMAVAAAGLVAYAMASKSKPKPKNSSATEGGAANPAAAAAPVGLGRRRLAWLAAGAALMLLICVGGVVAAIWLGWLYIPMEKPTVSVEAARGGTVRRLRGARDASAWLD